jgi:hypothetical protein
MWLGARAIAKLTPMVQRACDMLTWFASIHSSRDCRFWAVNKAGKLTMDLIGYVMPQCRRAMIKNLWT